MRFPPAWFCFAVAFPLLCLLLTDAVAEDGQWVSLFDGKTMSGWEKVGNEDSVWQVSDGALCGSGPASMLVCTKRSVQELPLPGRGEDQ